MRGSRLSWFAVASLCCHGAPASLGKREMDIIEARVPVKLENSASQPGHARQPPMGGHGGRPLPPGMPGSGDVLSRGAADEELKQMAMRDEAERMAEEDLKEHEEDERIKAQEMRYGFMKEAEDSQPDVVDDTPKAPAPAPKPAPKPAMNQRLTREELEARWKEQQKKMLEQQRASKKAYEAKWAKYRAQNPEPPYEFPTWVKAGHPTDVNELVANMPQNGWVSQPKGFAAGIAMGFNAGFREAKRLVEKDLSADRGIGAHAPTRVTFLGNRDPVQMKMATEKKRLMKMQSTFANRYNEVVDLWNSLATKSEQEKARRQKKEADSVEMDADQS